jgi:hypothetical protein
VGQVVLTCKEYRSYNIAALFVILNFYVLITKIITGKQGESGVKRALLPHLKHAQASVCKLNCAMWIRVLETRKGRKSLSDALNRGLINLFMH